MSTPPKIQWKPDPDDVDGYVAIVRVDGQGEIKLAANSFGWRAWVLGAMARDVILTDEHRRRDARANEGRSRRPLAIAMDAAERFGVELAARAVEDRT